MKKTENKKMLKNENKKMKAMVGLATLGAGSSLMAADVDDGSFEDLFDVFTSWLGGSLGKLLALLGFAGTFIVYMMTHKGSVLFIGIVISLIAGGIPGISQTFFNAGTNSFDTE